MLFSLPLGGTHKERGLPAATAAQAIRAFLRPVIAEPVPVPAAVDPAPVPEPPVATVPLPRAADKPEPAVEPEPAPKPEPSKEPEPSPLGGTPLSTAAIPATFLDPAQLTEHPKPLKEPAVHLLLPMLARSGMARLILYIDELGRVTAVEVDSATLPSATVERAVAIFSVVPFSPGRVDGIAVKTKVRITVGADERSKEN